MNRLSCIKVALAVALLLSTFAAGTAIAAGISVTPTAGTQLSLFEFTADGFKPGEPVSLWLGLPNGLSLGIGQRIARSDGSIEFSLQGDTSWPTGEYIAVAHGRQSGLEYFCKFVVSAAPQTDTDDDTQASTDNGTASGPDQAPDANHQPPVQMVFLGDPGGLAMNYNAQGYANGETVSVWVKDPATNQHRLPNVQTDPWGNLVFVFSLPPDALYGQYLITAQGLTTGRITYNTVTFWGGLRQHRSSDPISRAVPVYHVQGIGFAVGETVNIDLTFPDGSVRRVKQTAANEAGGVEEPVVVEPGWPQGIYALQAAGTASGHILKGRFNWDGQVTPLP